MTNVLGPLLHLPVKALKYGKRIYMYTKKKQTQRNKKEEFVDFAQVRRKQVLAQARARADGAAGARGTRQQQRLRLKRR